MATQIQLRRGTTVQHSSFTGAIAEVTVDTDKETVVVHDGSTAGGFPLATEAQVNDRMQVANVTAIDTATRIFANTTFLGKTASVALTGDVTGSANFSSNAVSISTSIAASGTPTGTFGSASKVPVITVGADGRVTAISNVNVAGVTNFTYAAANNTFTISTADGGSFDASIDELDDLATTAYAAANTYVNAQIGASNTSIRQYINAEIGSSNTSLRTFANQTFETKSVALAANNAQNSLILDRLQVSNAASLFVNVSGDTMSGALAMGTNKITGLGNPSAAQDAATKTYVDTEVANIVDSAPEALNTLNELAAALGDDANFATTTATTLGTKAANTYVNATFATKAYAAANTYVNAQIGASNTSIRQYVNAEIGSSNTSIRQYVNAEIGSSNTSIRSFANQTFETKSVALSANNAQNSLILDRIQVANAALVGTEIIAGNGLTGGGTLAANRTLNIGQGTGITVAADAISTNDGQIVHDNLSGFEANEHINHTTVTLTAGDGLTGGGDISASRSFAVGAGTLIDVTADAVSVDLSELTTSTSDGDGDFFVVVDSANAQKKLTKANINISGFNNDANYSTTTGTVTSVTVSAGTGLSGGGTITSSGTATLNVDLSELTDMTAGMVGTDEFIVLDAGADRRKAANEIGLSIFNNDAGFSTTTGTVTSVATGTGLTGGTITSTGTINVDVGTTANKIVQLNGSAQLPAVDGSLLTGISAGATVTDKSDNVNYNIVFTSETSGTQALAGIDNGAFTFNPSTGQCNATIFNATSDEKLKENVETINVAMDKVSSLRGVNFDWKKTGNKSMGVIAQEVEQVIPEVVDENEDGIKSVNYQGMVGLLIEALKDQQKQIDELKQIINNV